MGITYYPTYKTYLHPVRYIRDSVNGSTANTSSHWVEIQALDSAGNNIANGKTATLISGTTYGGSAGLVTDGNTSTTSYLDVEGTSPVVEVDLGDIYDIASVKIWHYFGDSRTYHSPVTQVSFDGSNWITVSDGSTYAETSSGKTWSCDSVPSQQLLVYPEIDKLYLFDGTSFNQIKEVYNRTTKFVLNGTTLENLTVGTIYNYEAYHSTASGTSGSSWNLSGCDYVTLTWSATVKMSWNNDYGLGSTSKVYLKLSDGTTILLGYKAGTLWTSGSSFGFGDTQTIDLTPYNQAQLSSVWLYATNGDMVASVQYSNSDRHELSVSTSNVSAGLKNNTVAESSTNLIYRANFVLFSNGVQNKDVSGDFKLVYNSGVRATSTGTRTKLDVSLDGSYGDGMWITNNAINLSEWSTLSVTVSNAAGSISFGVRSSSSSSVWDDNYLAIKYVGNGTHMLDVSELNSGYICVRLYGNGATTGPVYFNDIILE